MKYEINYASKVFELVGKWDEAIIVIDHKVISLRYIAACFFKFVFSFFPFSILVEVNSSVGLEFRIDCEFC